MRPLRGLLSSCTRVHFFPGVHGGHCLFAQSLVCSDSEPADSFAQDPEDSLYPQRDAEIQHQQLHSAQYDTSSDTAPDTQRQVVRDTPIYLSRHARLASRPVREPGSEPDSVARAGLAVAGLAILRAQHMVVGPQTPDLTSNTSPIRAGQHRTPEHYPRISFPGPCGLSHPEPAPC